MRRFGFALATALVFAFPSAPARGDPDLAALSGTARQDAERVFVLGRPDLLEPSLGDSVRDLAARRDALFGSSPGVREAGALLADRLWPLALRDLWWRPTSATETLALVRRLAPLASPGLEGPYRWLLGGGVEPFPVPAEGTDPWPELTALVLDRQHRETSGRQGLPEGSPLVTGPVRDAWRDWFPEYRRTFLETSVRRALHGDDPALLTDEERTDERRLDREAASARATAVWIAALGLVALVAAAGIGAWILGRCTQAPHA